MATIDEQLKSTDGGPNVGFILHTITDDASGNAINPSTTENQTNGSQKNQLVDSGDAAEEVDVETDADDLNPSGKSGLVNIAIMYARAASGVIRRVALDLATRALIIIGYEHHEIHSGSHYFICDYALKQASGATIEFVVTTPDTTKWAHLTFDFSASNGATLELYRDAADVVGGTLVTPTNNNENSVNTSDLTITKDPTSITAGTRVGGWIAGGGKTAGFNNRDREIILHQNKTYFFRFTSLAVSNDIGFCAEWYEHINKV